MCAHACDLASSKCRGTEFDRKHTHSVVHSCTLVPLGIFAIVSEEKQHGRGRHAIQCVHPVIQVVRNRLGVGVWLAGDAQKLRFTLDALRGTDPFVNRVQASCSVLACSPRGFETPPTLHLCAGR